MRIHQLLGAAVLFSMAHASAAQISDDAAASSSWRWGLDGRGGYYASERDRRDGGDEDTSEWRLRLRVWTERNLAPGWLFRVRAAGSFTTEQDEFRLRLDPYRATRTGVADGDVTLDEFFLRRQWQGGQLRVGRMQTGFTLPTVPAKSLDRNDSSNVGIGWTDGVHWQQDISDGWRSHLIAQYFHSKGTGNTVRSPLEFSDSGSRVGFYTALEARQALGPIVQRMVSVTWLPNSLASEGIASPVREDYVKAAAKAVASWPLNEAGTRLVLGGEVGHSFNQPQRSVLQLPGDGDTGGNAWQITSSLYDFLPGHHVGVVYGRAEGAWLTTVDYRNNDELFEVRYQRRFRPNLSMEARYRWRQELDARIGSAQKQRDQDVYVRLTWRYP